MTWSLRRAVLVLTAVAVLSSMAFLGHGYAQRKGVRVPLPLVDGPVPAQPANPEAKDGFDLAGIHLPPDTRLKRQVEAAADYIKSANDGNYEDWARATHILQSLIEKKEDAFAHLPVSGPDGKQVMAWVSVRTEAGRLLGNLPRQGKEFYKLTYGPKAAELFKQAKAAGDPELMGKVMSWYLHTDAGALATDWLGTFLLDRGEYVAASICFERLLEREGADKLPPQTMLKAAYAFHFRQTKEQEAGKGGADLVWRQLRQRGVREVRLAKGEPKSVDELQEYLAQLPRPNAVQSRYDSPTYRGGPERNAQYPGDTAFMQSLWKKPTVRNPSTTGEVLRQAEKQLQERHQPVLTSFFPVTATIMEGDKKVSLLLYRSYWGVHAVDMRSGKLKWHAHSSWSLDRMLGGAPDEHVDSRKTQAVQQWLQVYVNQNQRPGIVFENSVIDTLSTDNTYVYAVEDLAVPPPYFQAFNPGFPGGGVAQQFGGTDITDAVQHNLLQIFELSTGKLKHELGGTSDKAEKPDEFADTYFLSPPLPLGGKVYVLTEKQQELRLACIDPVHGKVLSLQPLCTTKEKLQQDIARRTQAAHLAYGEGILVCPTNAGAVFGVDLLSGSLVWAYPYREKDDTPQQPTHVGMGGFRRGLPPGMVIGPGGRLHPFTPSTGPQWKVTAPVIQDGKVVFTAPDAKSIHCLNLRDGSPAWSRKRQEDDLFLAGVFAGKVLVVGKKGCRALSLAKGETVWNLPDIGMPSGQGVASDNVYYLPLKETARGKEPAICLIDVERGQVKAQTKSRKKEVPGNLLFFDGAVISQTPTEVVAYPQLKVKIAQMDELLAKNPNDPAGLTERGELRLDKGDLPGAIDDLRAALRNKPEKETLAKARLRLYDALTELFQQDYSAAEEYLKEYEALCQVNLDGAAGDEEKAQRQAESRRRKANFLCLVAKGQEKQGKYQQAFAKYQQFAKVAVKDGDKEELITVIDEPTVQVAPDVWSGGRIRAMMEKAPPEQRKPLEDLIARQWEDLKKGSSNLEDLENFVRMFGSNSRVGKEARLYLAERQLEDAGDQALLKAEQNLTLLRGPNEEPETAARAVEALARLNTRKGLLEDAAYYYRLLGTKYAKVQVKDGKTGARLYEDLATDKRFLPYLDDRDGFDISRPVKVSDGERGPFPVHYQTYTFAHSGEDLPFFRRNHLMLHYQGFNQLKLVDQATGAERWSEKLSPTMMANLVNGGGQPHLVRFAYQNAGHLVVLPVGNLVFGIDPVGKKRILWERNLFGSRAVPAQSNPYAAQMNPNQNQVVVDPRDGSIQVVYQDGWRQRLGQAGPLQGGVICLQTRDALLALDPLTGRPLWTRSDVSTSSHIFGDDQNVYVVEMGTDNTPSSTRVFRAFDGATVPAPDFAPLYQKRVRMLGRHLLLSETGERNAVVLRLYDVLTGKDLWKQSYAPNSTLLRSEDEGLAGVVEPDGTVRVIDLDTAREVLKARMEPKHLEKVSSVHLLADPWNVYVACNGPADPNLMPWGGVQTNLMPGTGLRGLPVNGQVYAFERATGKLRWRNPVPNEMLVLNDFKDIPIALFTARHQKWINMNGPGRAVQQVISVVAFDKRTGKRLYDTDSGPHPNLQMQFHSLVVNPRAGKVEFANANFKLVFSVGDRAAGKGGAVSAPAGDARQGRLEKRRAVGEAILYDKNDAAKK